MTDQRTPMLLSAVRTPIARVLGGLASLWAPQLGVIVAGEAVARAGGPRDSFSDQHLGSLDECLGGGNAVALSVERVT